MVKVKKEGIIIESTKLDFENQAVLNPGCIQVDDYVHMFYRAVKEGNFSSIGYCKLKGPLTVVQRNKTPIIKSEFNYEKHGCEDARITSINNIFYLDYMAYDGHNVDAAYATSKDLKNFTKRGKITKPVSFAELRKLLKNSPVKNEYLKYELYDKNDFDTENTVNIWGKDIVLFPEKINGKFALLHRVLPNIHICYFKSFKDLTKKFWMNQYKNLHKNAVLKKKYTFESRALGAGAPPIKTKYGWLLIFHTIEQKKDGRIYRASAALLDLKNPSKVIGRLKKPLFVPEKKWELKGDVNNVVFPTGTALFGEKLYIYYGAADKRIAAASLDINELLDELRK